jgi:KaiC/GvpD/RAD55 family RecA-like ATPase
MDLPPLGVDEKHPILRKNRATTGIADFDIMLEGGYTNPGMIMVLGPTGMEKMAFAFHFANAATEKEKVFYITADASPEDVINKASTIGIDLKPTKNRKFIDCYTSTLGSKQETKSEHIMIAGPSALNDLSLAINEAIKESAGCKMRVIFHSLSSFVLYNPKDSLLKFLQVVGGRLKTADATVMMLVEDGMHEKQLLSAIDHSMDQRYIIHDKGGAFELEIPDIPAFVPIKFTPEGIKIV